MENKAVDRPLKCPTGPDRRSAVAGMCVLLAVAVFLVFGQTLRHEFINYDDEEYFYDNPQVQHGLTWSGVAWAFRTMYAANWHPLTWLSLMLDAQLFGAGPMGPHLTNVILHAVNTVLLFLLLRRLSGAYWRSALVAALFGLHPLHVESVAWVSERKDVLSGLFFMLTLLMYARYVEESKVRCLKSKVFYGLALLFFALGLMSKPMLVTLPFVLLLLDYWPLQRFMLHDSRKVIARMVWEKLPFLLLSAAACVATVLAQQELIKSTIMLPFTLRFGNALVAYATYFVQMVWPEHLAVFYPYRFDVPDWQTVGTGILLLFITLLAFRTARRFPYFATGWLWYLGMLVPVIGLVQVGEQARADRYTYLPLIGVFILLAWGTGEVFERWRYRRQVLGAGAFTVIAVLMVCSSIQTSYWRDSESLWTHTLACTSGNYVGLNNLGHVFAKRGQTAEAMKYYQMSLEIKPGYMDAHNNFGVVLAEQGRFAEAMEHYQRALEIKPDFAGVHYNLGNLLTKEGRIAEANECYQRAIEIKPDFAEAHYNLGGALARQGRNLEAINQYQQVIEINPDFAGVHNNLGVALVALGSNAEAISHFQKALKNKSDNAEAHYNLGVALDRQGKPGEAIDHYQKALAIKPDYAEAHNNLGMVLARQGQSAEAIRHFQQALEIKPDYAEAHNNLGNALGDQGRYAEAAEHYRKAIEFKPDYAEAYYNLGNALALQGKYAEAIGHFQKALQLKPDDVNARNSLNAALALQSQSMKGTGKPSSP